MVHGPPPGLTPRTTFGFTFWNVPSWAQAGLYVGGMVAIAVLAYGRWQRVQLWRQGLPEERLDRIPDRVRLVVRHALLQVRTLSQAYPGIMHAIMIQVIFVHGTSGQLKYMTSSIEATTIISETMRLMVSAPMK